MNSGSVLVWSLESVLLGLWAVVFSLYSTPLHAFIARCHVIAASFTLFLHLVASARSLDLVAWAASQAFLCFVSALFVCYCVALADAGNPVYFSLPSVGLLPLDACIGISWLLAALVSSLGMALVPVAGRKSSLMVHYYGYHLVVMAPSVLLMVPSGVGVFFMLLWILHVIILAVVVGAGHDDATGGLFMKMVAFSGRLACVVVAVVDMILSGGSVLRFSIAVVLLVVSILNQLDWIGDLEAFFQQPPDHNDDDDAPRAAAVVPTNTTAGVNAARRSRDPAAIGLRYVKRHTSP